MLTMPKVQMAKRCIRNDRIKCALRQPVDIPWVHPSRSLASKWSNMRTLRAFFQFRLVPLASILRRLKESLCGSGGISWDLCTLSFSLFAELRPSTWQKSPMECSRAHLEELLWRGQRWKKMLPKLELSVMLSWESLGMENRHKYFSQVEITSSAPRSFTLPSTRSSPTFRNSKGGKGWKRQFLRKCGAQKPGFELKDWVLGRWMAILNKFNFHSSLFSSATPKRSYNCAAQVSLCPQPGDKKLKTDSIGHSGLQIFNTRIKTRPACAPVQY